MKIQSVLRWGLSPRPSPSRGTDPAPTDEADQGEAVVPGRRPGPRRCSAVARACWLRASALWWRLPTLRLPLPAGGPWASQGNLWGFSLSFKRPPGSVARHRSSADLHPSLSESFRIPPLLGAPQTLGCTCVPAPHASQIRGSSHTPCREHAAGFTHCACVLLWFISVFPRLSFVPTGSGP